MAGALRFITNKPDPKAFSAGVDLDGGKIEGGTHNGAGRGVMPIFLSYADWTAIRLSVYSDYHGGYINNLDVTRNWVNGVVSNNSEWAGRNYNTEKVNGGRLAVGQKIADGWKATLTTSYQSQLTHGAWDENPTIGGAVNSVTGALPNGPTRLLGQDNVDRFGPEFKQYYTKTIDFHLEGDVGIGDLVYANTWWAQDDRWVNEYSEYMQYLNEGPYFNATSQQGYDCLTDPVSTPGDKFTGCKAPIQYYDYDQHIDRWSNELRLQSKAGGWFHWSLGGYWEKSRDLISNYYHMPGLQSKGQAYQTESAYYGQTLPPPAPDDWYSYVSRSDYLQVTEFTNETLDITPRLHLELGTVHFQSHFSGSTYGGFWYSPESPTTGGGSSEKWNSKVDLSYKPIDSLLVYADWAQGFRDGGVNRACLPGASRTEFRRNSFQIR